MHLLTFMVDVLKIMLVYHEFKSFFCMQEQARWVEWRPGGYTQIMPLDHLFHMLVVGEFPGVRVGSSEIKAWTKSQNR